MMKIPSSTKKPRFYVATSMREACSSWDTLGEAWSAMAETFSLREADPWFKSKFPAPIGIVQTGSAVIVDTRNLIEKVK